MVYKNSNKTWKSNFIVVELYFPVDFELEFPDSQSSDYVIKFYYNKSREIHKMSTDNLVFSLN